MPPPSHIAMAVQVRRLRSSRVATTTPGCPPTDGAGMRSWSAPGHARVRGDPMGYANGLSAPDAQSTFVEPGRRRLRRAPDQADATWVRIGLKCLAALVALACGPAAANADVVPGRVVVAFEPGATAAARADARADVGGVIRDTVAARTQVLDVPDGTVNRSVRELDANPDVAWAAPDHVVHAQVTVPNDPSFPNQWAWHNTGQYSGTPGVDIEAEQAWDVSTGAGALVAIVDTGVTTGNVDFAGASKLWTNPHPGDGGCVDTSVQDLHGCDLVNDDGAADDDNGHGTAVASEAAANFDDGAGMAGVAPGAQLMPIKVLGSSGSGSAAALPARVGYAADPGAKIVHGSIGGPPGPSPHPAIAP